MHSYRADDGQGARAQGLEKMGVHGKKRFIEKEGDMSQYLTVAMGKNGVLFKLDDNGRYSILEQWPLNDREQVEAAQTGHRFRAFQITAIEKGQ